MPMLFKSTAAYIIDVNYLVNYNMNPMNIIEEVFE